VVRGLSIDITPKLISRVTTLPLGVPWRKEDKGDSEISKRKFFLEADETLIKIQRHQLPIEDWWQSMLEILPR